MEKRYNGEKANRINGGGTYTLRPFIQTLLVFFRFGDTRRMGLVLGGGVKGDRAIDTVKTSVAATVVLIQLGFFDYVAAGY